MTADARDGLAIHEDTIKCAERLEQEVAGLEGRLQASREQVRQQEQVIKDMRGQRDSGTEEWLQAIEQQLRVMKRDADKIIGKLRKERDDLKKQIEAADVQTVNAFNEASKHIVNQDREIALLERENKENCDIAGAHIVRIVRMSRNIKDLQKECYMKDSDIKQLRVRLANCGHYAELATKNGGFQVGLSLNNIKVEATININASQATNVKTGEVYEGPEKSLKRCGHWAKLALRMNPSYIVSCELARIIKESKQGEN